MAGPPVTVFVPPSLRRFEARRPPVVWSAHAPLAYDLAEALRPRLAVAVGVRHGATYFAWCQSVREHGLDTLSYAVGSWDDADGETDGTGETLYDDVRSHNREFYFGFSYAARMPSGQAAGHFEDGTVDLLCLDEDVDPAAVPAEFERWFVKLRPGGVMLCHDAGAPGSPLRGFWDERATSNQAVVFDGDPAPGILRRPGGSPPAPGAGLLRLLFQPGEAEHDGVRAVYARAARFFELRQLIGSGGYGRVRKGHD